MSKKSNILALCGSFCIFAGVLLFSETVYADTVTFNGSTYEVFEEGMTWTEAEEYCENLGGHLVVISSEEEQKFVSGLLSSRLEYYWIGGQYYRNIDAVSYTHLDVYKRQGFIWRSLTIRPEKQNMTWCV